MLRELVPELLPGLNSMDQQLILGSLSVSSKLADGKSPQNAEYILRKTCKSKRGRLRGKRRPKGKEQRRRVRAGKSRSRFARMGAPLNDNEFLINQHETEKANNLKDPLGLTIGQFVNSFEDGSPLHANPIALSPGESCATACGHCDICTGELNDTSDYSSLYSPAASHSSKLAEERDFFSPDNLSDEVFDEEFLSRNFEADYSAQQREMKEELLKLPRRVLEERCSALMDRAKFLEERCLMRPTNTAGPGAERITSLQHQLELLTEENERLKARLDLEGEVST